MAASASEPPHGCYASIAEALAGRDASAAQGSKRLERVGFRVESWQRDALLPRSWVTLRRCDHPEQPAVTVLAEDGRDAGGARSFTAEPAVPERTVAASRSVAIVLAGMVVRLERTETNLHFDTTGIAQSNGAVGERIRVRLVRPFDAAGEPPQYLTATIRSAELLEVEP